MDLFNIPKLIEQGVYDVMMWILFFPLTMFRMIASPRQTLRYVRLQADNEKLDTAFSDAMRPALFLFVSILVGSVIAPDTADEIKVMSESRFGSVIFGSWASNMAFSMIIYCIVPLIGALFLALSRGEKVTRDSLHVPFDQQCYIGGPSTLAFTSAVALNPYVGSGTTGLILFCAAVWLIVVEYIYFRDNSPIGPLAALGLVIATLMTSIIIVALILIFAFSAPQVG